jgi:hypothetical protein
LAGRHDEQRLILRIENEHMSDNLPLHIGKKRFATLAGVQRFNVVGAHIMQEGRTITAGYTNGAPPFEQHASSALRHCRMLEL